MRTKCLPSLAAVLLSPLLGSCAVQLSLGEPAASAEADSTSGTSSSSCTASAFVSAPVPSTQFPVILSAMLTPAQTFTVGYRLNLTVAEIYVSGTGVASLEIAPDTGGGQPSTTGVLGSANLTSSNGTASWMIATFSTPITLEPGTTYWLIVRPVSGSLTLVRSNNEELVPTGQSFASNLGGPFNGIGDSDEDLIIRLSGCAQP